MPINTRFFVKNENITLKDIISISEAKISEDIDIEIGSINTLADSQIGDISFFHNAKYLQDFKNTKASFVFCSPKDSEYISPNSIALVHDNPYFAYSQAASLMYSIKKEYNQQIAKIDAKEVAKTAIIENNVIIGEGSVIEDCVILKNGVIIGKNVIIKSGTIIGQGVEIDDNTVIDYNAVIEFAKIGKNCHIYSGVKIGQRGYGFAVDPLKMKIIDVPQYGGVLIEDFVDIGANTTIDRGAINDTKIGMYTKIDNLVQIGHNVQIDAACFIVAQVGIAGGTEIGSLTSLGGQVGVAGHLKIGHKVAVTAQSGVHSNIPDGAIYSGTPAIENRLWKRAMAQMSMNAKKKRSNNNQN